MFKEVSTQSTTTAKFLDERPPLQYVSRKGIVREKHTVQCILL